MYSVRIDKIGGKCVSMNYFVFWGVELPGCNGYAMFFDNREEPVDLVVDASV